MNDCEHFIVGWIFKGVHYEACGKCGWGTPNELLTVEGVDKMAESIEKFAATTGEDHKDG